MADASDLDDLRERGRRVLAKVPESQRRSLAARIPDQRTDDDIRADYARAMAAKAGSRR